MTRYIFHSLVTLPVSLLSTFTFGARTCEDNINFRYQNNPKQSCNSIRLINEEKRTEYCSLNDEVRNACPQACGLCCEDNDDYTFLTNKGTKASCAWLTEKEKDHRPGKYCNTYSSGSMVRNQW